MVTLKIKLPHIIFNVSIDVAHFTQQIPYCKWDKRMRAFKVPFSAESLILLKKFYPECRVVEGQKHIDRLKKDMVCVARGKELVLSYDATRDYRDPLLDYRVTPFKHQYQGLHYLNAFDGAALFADCGTGKTFMIAWDIASKYLHGDLDPSSVLIVGKLMTLDSGWYESISAITELTSDVLWGQTQSKSVNLDEVIVANHGPKPEGKSKRYDKTEYFFKGTDNVAYLKSPRYFNEKRHDRKTRKWKQVGDVKYGTERLATVRNINVRSNNIKDKIFSRKYDIHIINHEGLLNFKDALKERKYQYVVVDESTVLRNPKGKVFKALLEVSEYSRFRRILTGTPSPQGPQDLWSQMYFLDRGVTLGSNYKAFIDKHFDIISFGSFEKGTFKGSKPIVRKHGKKGLIGTVEYIQGQLENRVFVCKLRDCIDLPELLLTKLDVFLESDQRANYEEMKENLSLELGSTTVSVNTALAKIMKLRQITGGFILDREGSVIRVSKKNPKLEVLKSLIDEFGNKEKVVIFAIYRAEIEMLLRHFGTTAVAVYGGVSAKQKLDARKAFIEDPDIRYMICQPKSAAYGVDGLQKVCRYLIFYSIDYSSDTNYQAIKRIERVGQGLPMFVYYLLAKDTIDKDIYASIYAKDVLQQQTINNNLVKMYQGGSNVT